MNRVVFSIVILALLAESCTAGIVLRNKEPQHLDRLYRAVVDVATTCFGDPGSAIGVAGDKDGSILKALRSNHLIPVVLVDDATNGNWDTARSHQLQVFIIVVDSLATLVESLKKFDVYIWWNYYGNFVIVDKRPELKSQCQSVDMFMFVTTRLGLLNVQFMCSGGEESVVMWTTNPFMRRAPKVWSFVKQYQPDRRRNVPPSSLYSRMYREGGQSCESINFPKTGNVAGFPLLFLSHVHPGVFSRKIFEAKLLKENLQGSKKLFMTTIFNEQRWLIDNIVGAMNVSPTISRMRRDPFDPGMFLHAHILTTKPELVRQHISRMIVRLDQWPLFAVSQHTDHMTQLDKILSVIDRESRIGMWLVYLITFLFFKFFLGQPAVESLMNLVRLTSNVGLTKLPKTIAPTFFLTSLFMFVVTLQAIYTGNLATLLTTTVPYPNVQTREDIPKLGYTLYTMTDTLTKLTGDPILQGSIMERPDITNCTEYILRDPLAVCAQDYIGTISSVRKWKLHVSRQPISNEYNFYITTEPNMFKRRIEEIMKTLFEAGLSKSDPIFEQLRLPYVDDDEVKKNTVRRVMTFDDLRFAFVILGVGLLISFLCFVGEIVVCAIRLKCAKRRDRVRALSAWGATADKGPTPDSEES